MDPYHYQLVKEIVEFAHAHKVPEGHMVGQPFVLMPWEIEWIEGTFDPRVMVSLLSIARRNGKTGLASIIIAAALYGPLVLPNSLLLSASRSKEQASIIHRYTSKAARLSGFMDQLQPRDSLKEMTCIRTGVEYKAVSADAPTQHGKGSRILVTDELGQVRGPRDELYETMSTGMGSYTDSKHIIISTRAPSDNDLFNMLLDDALTGEDPTTFAMDFSTPEEYAIDDPEGWKFSNPSLESGVRNLADLERQAREAMRIPAREAPFRNLTLNQKVSATASFITKGVWDSGNQPINEELFHQPGNPVYAALDLSARVDITGLVVAVEDPNNGEVHVKPYCWIPEDNLDEKIRTDKIPYDRWIEAGLLRTVAGKSIHYELLAPDIAEILGQYEIELVAFDRWRIDQLGYELDKIGFYVPMKPMGQGYKDMSPAVDETESLLLDGKLIHGGHAILTNHVSNVVIDSDPTNARKPNKAKSINKIDLAVAMIMAIGTLKKVDGEEEGGGGLYGSDEGARVACV